MESRAKAFGHAIHPMLIVYPLGLLSTAVVFDIIHLITDSGKWAEIAYWLIAAGLIGGAGAAVTGWIDWFAIPANTRAKSLGLLHGVGNAIVMVLFAISWLLRRGDVQDPGMLPFILALAGLALATVTGWMGGELIERLGVAVDEGAHLDAPNSLSGQPATTNLRRGEAQRGGTEPRPAR